MMLFNRAGVALQLAHDRISAWISVSLEMVCTVDWRVIGEVEVEGKIKAN